MATSADIDMENEEAIAKMENSLLPEARTLLKLLFGMAVSMKKQEEAKEAELQRSHLQLEDLQKNLRMQIQKNNVIQQMYEDKLQKMIADAMNDGNEGTVVRLMLNVSVEQDAQLDESLNNFETLSITSTNNSDSSFKSNGPGKTNEPQGSILNRPANPNNRLRLQAMAKCDRLKRQSIMSELECNIPQYCRRAIV